MTDPSAPVYNHFEDCKRRSKNVAPGGLKTGATPVWASTTPIPDKNQTAASIVERNEAAASLMETHGIATDDLFTAITPQLAKLQNPNDVHFTAAGYEFLGQQVAESIEQVLKAKSGEPQP